MAKVVLTSNPESIYDDLPEKRYHFPRPYLRAVEEARGDWAIYYESGRSGGRRAYFAVAQIVDVQPDPQREGLYYAFVGGYLDFQNMVPVRNETSYYESALQADDGELNRGTIQRAVRRIPDGEFELIVQSGFAQVVGLGEQPSRVPSNVAQDEPAIFQRPIVEQVVRRPFRDTAFKAAVRTAYQATCAMTGLKMINGGGRSEAEAAHIRPVQDSGPDSVRNGIALSGTVHWMFDRGLVSIGDDYTILRAQKGIPEAMQQLFNRSGRLLLPEATTLRPHPQFLQYHRERVFKG
ncbi:MAG: HNH endonuclease [Alphaproteobacteria bacterium]|nr:HNH endonuclease [Alphaproteobacteria bacterium]